MSPEENSNRIVTSFFDTSSSDLFYENMQRAKRFSLLHCDGIIDALNEYSKTMSGLIQLTEGEALVLEKTIKFWLQTKEEINKK